MKFVRRYWLGISSVLAISVSGFFLYRSLLGYYSYPSEGIAETLGKSLVYALLGFFVASSLRKRWKRTKLEFLIFCLAASFSVCAIYDSLKASTQTHQLSNSKREIARLANDFSGEKPSQTSVNEYSTEEYGDFSKMLPIIQHSLEFSEKMTSDINAACVGFEDVLSPSYLCKHKNILQAKELVNNFLDTLDDYEKRYKDEFVLMESKIKEAFSGKENLKRSALKGFEKGKAASSKLVSEYFLVERESAQSINNILNFLSSRFGSFWESNGTLIFKKDNDAEMYNSLVQKLITISEKEDIVVEKMESNKQLTLEKMKNFDQD